MMQELPTKCIICGAPIKPEILHVKYSNGYMARIPKEICDKCADPKPRPAVFRHYNNPNITPFVRLAGAIECSVLKHYRHLYEAAVQSAWNVLPEDELTEEELTFARFHSYLAKSNYHSILTMGNLPELLDFTRRSVEQEMPGALEKIRDGYSVFKRYQNYLDSKKEQSND